MVEKIILNNIETMQALKFELEHQIKKTESNKNDATLQKRKNDKAYFQGQLDLLLYAYKNLNTKINQYNLEQIYKQQNIQIIIK